KCALAPIRFILVRLDLIERNVPPLAHLHFAVAPDEYMRGRKFLDALKDRVRVGRPQKRQILIERLDVEFTFNETRRKERFDLGSEDERRRSVVACAVRGRVVERLDAEPVACEQERARLFVPQRKGEDAVEMREKICAPLRVGCKQDFRVRVGAKALAARFEFATQLAIVVNLAVEADLKTPVSVTHRLMPGRRRVNDRQPPMTETHTPPVIINRRARPHTFVVAPAMLNAPQHSSDARVWLTTDQSGDTAHRL